VEPQARRIRISTDFTSVSTHARLTATVAPADQVAFTVDIVVAYVRVVTVDVLHANRTTAEVIATCAQAFIAAPVVFDVIERAADARFGTAKRVKGNSGTARGIFCNRQYYCRRRRCSGSNGRGDVPARAGLGVGLTVGAAGGVSWYDPAGDRCGGVRYIYDGSRFDSNLLKANTVRSVVLADRIIWTDYVCPQETNYVSYTIITARVSLLHDVAQSAMNKGETKDRVDLHVQYLIGVLIRSEDEI